MTSARASRNDRHAGLIARNAGGYKLALTLVLFLACTIPILEVYYSNGVGWDFLSHYLNARTISSGYLYSHLGLFAGKESVTVNLAGAKYALEMPPALIVGKNIYFDWVWEPLPSLIMAAFIIPFGSLALPIYLAFLVAFLLFSAYVAAKGIGIDPLLLVSIAAGPFMIRYAVLYNGNEILASGLVLLTSGLILTKDRRAGLAAGLMGLAKYTSLLLLPLGLFLGRRRDILIAAAICGIIFLPWLLVNYAEFGNPLQSYVLQLAETQPQGSNPAEFLSLVLSIVSYPLVMLAASSILLAYLCITGRKCGKSLRGLKKFIQSRQGLFLLSFLALSLLGFGFAYDNAQGSIRLGYMLYLGMAFLAAAALSARQISAVRLPRGVHLGAVIPYVVFAVTMASILAVWSGWAQAHYYILGALGSRNADFAGAASALYSHGLGNCSVVSNAWPYLDFYNVTAYSPYLCNATVGRMPIVVFNRIGVRDYCNGNISGLAGTQAFSYANFSIYLPSNYACVR